jgi:hypothetical protein
MAHPLRAIGAAGFMLAAVLLAAPRVSAGQGPAVASDVAVKAAFLFNFAKFTDWPNLPAAAPITTCIVGDDAIAAAFVETVRDQRINGHALPLAPSQDAADWRNCRMLFVGQAEAPRSAAALDGLTSSPVLTVSDSKDFAAASGIIELYVDNGRMRFAINVDAAERAGLRLSSRLLGLARIVRGRHGS